jgi:hypothetical protein
MSASPTTPPTTPPTMLPIFASPLAGIVSPPSESEPAGSGPMSPAAASPDGREGAGVVPRVHQPDSIDLSLRAAMMEGWQTQLLQGL